MKSCVLEKLRMQIYHVLNARLEDLKSNTMCSCIPHEWANADHYAIATGKLRMQIYHVITRHRLLHEWANAELTLVRLPKKKFKVTRPFCIALIAY